MKKGSVPSKVEGFSLIASIFVMIIFIMLGLTLVSLLSANVYSSAKGLNYMKAFYASEGGVIYAINRLLRNDYNWEDNVFDLDTEPIRKLLAGYSGYPPAGGYTGNADFNAITRHLEGSYIDMFITHPAARDLANDPDPHWQDTQYYPWFRCVINVPTNAHDSHASINQEVFRYLCPSLNYAMSAASGKIQVNASSVSFSTTGTLTFAAISSGAINIPPPQLPPYYYCYSSDSNWYPLDVDTNFFNSPLIYTEYKRNEGRISDGTYNDIFYCEGDVYIGDGGDVIINGSIIAAGNIYIAADTSLTVNPNPSSLIADANFPAIIAGGKIVNESVGRATGHVTINGFIFARGHIDINAGNSTITIDGAISAAGRDPDPEELNGIKLAAEVLNLTYNSKVRLTYGMFDNHPNREFAHNNEFRYGVWREVLKFQTKPAP